jgi:hypothetical protein
MILPATVVVSVPIAITLIAVCSVAFFAVVILLVVMIFLQGVLAAVINGIKANKTKG